MPVHTNSLRSGDYIEADRAFTLLKNERRRNLLREVLDRDDPAMLEELAVDVALEEADGAISHEQYARVSASLYHVHAPCLADAAAIEYDHDTETVAEGPAANELVAYLELTDKTFEDA